MPEPSRKAGDPIAGPTPTGPDFLPSYSGPQSILDNADEKVRERDLFSSLDPEDADVIEGRIERKLGIGFWVAAGWLVTLAVLALIAPLITEGHGFLDILSDPDAGISSNPEVETNAPPGTAGNILGTDALGRDLLSRTIWGARISLTVGFAAVGFGLFIGGMIGLVAGYFRGMVETGLMGAMDVMLAFPALILALAIVTFTGKQTLPVITLAIGIVAIPPLARLVRANTLVYSQREFVLAAKTLGASSSRIMWREIVPNVSRAAFSFAIIGIAVAIVAEGFLAFIGVSLPPPTATWGTMINEGRSDLQDSPWVTMVPAAALFFTVMALNFAGDRLRQYFDIREGGL
jgi:peptide/nickel transport system permease protein